MKITSSPLKLAFRPACVGFVGLHLLERRGGSIRNVFTNATIKRFRVMFFERYTFTSDFAATV